MDDCISRKKAVDACFDGWNNTPHDCAENIRQLPAADVRPVVRGHWIGIDDFPHDDWECDHCGCVVESTNDPWNYYHYCPNCGADMREES
jgi:rubrerythrin